MAKGDALLAKFVSDEALFLSDKLKKMAGTSKSMNIYGKAASTSGASLSHAGAALQTGHSTSQAGAASILDLSTSRARAASKSGSSTSRAGAASMSGPSKSRAAVALTSRAAENSETSVKEFRIRLANTPKNYNIMRFHDSLDFTQWRDVKMKREESLEEPDKNAPKVGRGRKKYFRPSKAVEQPWILKDGAEKGKKFKGTKAGGVSDNCDYYVFAQQKDGTIEAYPVKDWYNFQPVQRYKTLSAEEAEKEFGRKEKVMNYFSLMVQKRLGAAGEEAEEQDAQKNKLEKSLNKSTKKLKITDEEEWMDSEDSSDNEECEDLKTKPKEKSSVQRGKKVATKKKAKPAVYGDDSDDANEAGREMDYYATSSEEEPDAEAKVNKDMKSVADVDSSDEDDATTDSDDSEKDDDEEEKEDKKDKKKTKNVASKKERQRTLSSDSSLSTDSFDTEENLSNGPLKKKPKVMSQVTAAAIAAASAATAAAAAAANAATTTGKTTFTFENDLPGLSKIDTNTAMPLKIIGTVSNYAEYVDSGEVTEEAVRRYLKRKPTTATELLVKFKYRTGNVSNESLLANLSEILKKINPKKQKIQGKMHFSL